VLDLGGEVVASRTLRVRVLAVRRAGEPERLFTMPGWGHRPLCFLTDSDAVDFRKECPDLFRGLQVRVVEVGPVALELGAGAR